MDNVGTGNGPSAANGGGIGIYNQTVLRANRFTPTPWHEIYGINVRYKLPQTLHTKIRAAITNFMPSG